MCKSGLSLQDQALVGNMKIRIYQDKTCNLDLADIVNNLNRKSSDLSFSAGDSKFVLTDSNVSTPLSHSELARAIDLETSGDDIVFIFTEKPYDNGQFWEIYNRKIIISFFGWGCLTRLSRNNSAVYFICSMFLYDFIRDRSQHNAGCMMDFWWNRNSVDESMKSAFVCQLCLDKLKAISSKQQQKMIGDILNIVHELSLASRSNMDICQYWKLRRRNEMSEAFLRNKNRDRNWVDRISKYPGI
jgi:hypothetical protein